MQVTELQVQRSIEALTVTDATPIGRSAEIAPRTAVGGPVPAAAAWPDGLVARPSRSPSIRDDRVEEARRQLETGAAPTAEALAQRMVGRLVCDRLR